jgi:putative transport protein
MASLSERVQERLGSRYGKREHSVKWLVIGIALAALLGGVLFVLTSETAFDRNHPIRRFFGGLLKFLGDQPFTLLFITLAGGYVIAKLKVKGITLGATAGTLMLGLAVSLWASALHDIEFRLPDFAGSLFFNLFMFAVGMKVGPQFLVGLHRGAKDFIILSLFVPLLATAMMFGMRALIDMPPGIAVGIFAGSNTATPGLGAAQAAFASGAAKHLGDITQATGNMATAFAFGYCISTVLFVVMLKALPRIFRRDAVAEGQKFEREISPDGTILPGSSVALETGALPVKRRTYRILNPAASGHSLGALRIAFPALDIESVVRDDKPIPCTDDTVLKVGDEIAVFGPVAELITLTDRLGPEIDSRHVPPMELQTVEVVLRNERVAGRKLGTLAEDVGHGLYLNALFRGGENLPRGPEVVVQKGDVFRVTGSPERIAQLEKTGARILRSTTTTDILTLCLGLAVGGFLGGLALPVGGIKFSLGSVALLLVGVAFSAIRTRNPLLGGPFPEPARQLFEDLGLNVFVGVLGLNAGMGVVKAIQSGAIVPILIGSAVIGLIPPLVGWALGQFPLKMNIAELLGAIAGARCSSPGMRAAQEAAQSTAPAIAYPVTFAISNVVLTLITYLFAVLD